MQGKNRTDRSNLSHFTYAGHSRRAGARRASPVCRSTGIIVKFRPLPRLARVSLSQRRRSPGAWHSVHGVRWMFTIRDLLAGILLPSALSAVIVTAGWRVARRTLSERDARWWASGSTIGIAVASGWIALLGWPGFPPLDPTDGLKYLALGLAALAAIEPLGRCSPQAHIAVAVAAVAAVF
jgi:hypothetical protein